MRMAPRNVGSSRTCFGHGTTSLRPVPVLNSVTVNLPIQKQPSSLRSSCLATHARCMVQCQAQPGVEDFHRGPQGAGFDVTDLVVNPVYRSTPFQAEKEESRKIRSKARILFVSESNVCRSILAESVARSLISEYELEELLECESRGSRDYNLGDRPEASVLATAAELGLTIAEDKEAQQFDHVKDIVTFDLVLVMDKFTAADVLREVSAYDLINKAGNYTLKVRRLGDFHPRLSQINQPDAQDIDDPLYGNVGGDTEKEAVKQCAGLITESCVGLMQFLKELSQQPEALEGEKLFPVILRERVADMQQISWLVPPMLRGRSKATFVDDFNSFV